MAWTRSDFVSIMESDIAKAIYSDDQLQQFTKDWSLDNKAALLHANGVTNESVLEDKLPLLQLVAAFGCKDAGRLRELVNYSRVPVGARLDYMLPLYDESYGAGEDIFVASTKVMLGGGKDIDAKLKPGAMLHKVGDASGAPYSNEELSGIEGYINNSFEIREILLNAPNKSLVEPTKEAVEYMLQNAATYRDSNNNPVIVFIPGAISIPGYTTPELISRTLSCGAHVDDVGFFGVPGIVWSIILADVDAVKTFIRHGAKLDLEDEMRNESVGAWAVSTSAAVQASGQDLAYCERMLAIHARIEQTLKTKTSVGQVFGLFASKSQVPTSNVADKVHDQKFGI